MSSLEDNKAKALRIYKAMSEADLATIDELVAADMVNNDPSLPPLAPGIAGYKQLIGLIKAGVPDAIFEVVDQVAEGDLVASRWIISGTHQGEFLGIPATNKKVATSGTVIQRFENNKSQEHWAIWDTMGLLVQLGVVPGGK